MEELNRMEAFNDKEINSREEVMKKSIFSANNQFDYRKMMFPKPYLIPMELKEDGEELIFSYEKENLKSLLQIREEDILTILAVLMSIEQLKIGLEEYDFSLNPDNLYYDRNRIVQAKIRDIYDSAQGIGATEFIEDYKALIGFALQKKYSFADYKKGGKKLLYKTPLLKKMKGKTTIPEIIDVLNIAYEEIETERKEKKILVNKGSHKRLKYAVIFLSFISITVVSGLGYWFLIEDSYKNAVIVTNNAYIAEDYVGSIDGMRGIPLAKMEIHEKFILANAYIRGENLSQEQKHNILNNISLTGAEGRLDYWINLGRGDTDKAIDIAMQQSDDQLLLYAYMNKKASIETDTTLSGEEKTSQLETVYSQMDSLMGETEIKEK